MHRWGYAIASLVLTATACVAVEPTEPIEPPGEETAAQQYRRETALLLATRLDDDVVRDDLVAELRRSGSIELATRPELGVAAFAGDDAVAELALIGGDLDIDELLIAYAPAGSEASWEAIVAYTRDGRRVSLDPWVAPDVPVIVVETHGRLAMRRGIEQANRTLQRLGVQRAPEAIASAMAGTAGAWTIRLDEITLQDDQEPWISGAAEVYAIASGVIGDNEPELRIVELPYLDHDGTRYLPRQIVLDWTHYGYQAANVQLFEHDEGISYQSLVVELVNAIGAIGSLAGYPAIAAVTEIASRIVGAMPAGWFSNDDDFLDSFYTLEKSQSYANLAGVSHNATVTLTRFFLAAND